MKEVRWGIIGCGDVTEVKSGPALQNARGSQLVAVMRRSGDLAQDYAARHSVPKWYDDADALINDPEVNAIYVATPPSTHCEYALRACAAGKPTYVEKPMARNHDECQQMVRAFWKADLKLFVAYYRRALPRFLFAKEQVDSGRLGTITGATYRYAKPIQELVSASLPWRLRAEESGGGLFFDLGSHALDIIDFLLGPLVESHGTATNRAGRYAVEDNVVMHFRTGRQIPGVASWDFASHATDDCLEIFGTAGSVALSIFGNEPVVVNRVARRDTFDQPNPKHIQQPLIQKIVDDLLGNGACPSTGESAARTSAVMDTVTKSYYGTRDDGFWETGGWGAVKPDEARPRNKLRWLLGVGPAIIVASVVLGPGSILTSSKVGQTYGYSMAWVLVVAGVLMFGMVALAGRLGVTLKGTLCQEIAARVGRPAAVMIGVAMFLIVASFQSGNNAAVVAAVQSLSSAGNDRFLAVVVLLLLNGVIIVALYGLRNLYVSVEWLMKLLVVMMIVGFVANVVRARPSLVELGKGILPQLPESGDWLPLLGLIATTFSVGGAFYQGYLVREKGWTTDNLRQGAVDSAVGITVLCGVTMVIMTTSAAVLHGGNVKLESAADVGQQLEPLFGRSAKILFSVGLLAGAVSSFMVNAMIGGAVLADGCGLGWSMNQRWPKAFTVAALLCGMTVALVATAFNVSTVGLIVFAQALTVVAVPLLAISLLFLALRSSLKDKQRVPIWIVIVASIGAIVTLLLAGRTVVSIVQRFST